MSVINVIKGVESDIPVHSLIKVQKRCYKEGLTAVEFC